MAIPSANQSSRLSTVSPLGVWQEFKDKVKMIFDGGESSIGIESTVLDLSGKIKILRPGFIQAKIQVPGFSIFPIRITRT